MIYMSLPDLPPTDNHAYIDVVAGKGKRKFIKRTLTKEGKAYKASVTSYIVSTFPAAMTMFKPNTPYGYIVQLVIPNLLNKTWPESAESRYKKLDAINRSKLLQDAMASAFGIDDSVFLSVRYDKVHGETAQTNIWVWNMEEEKTS